MVESSLKQYLIDLYERSLLLNVDCIYENYRYTVENNKIILLELLGIDLEYEQNLKKTKKIYIKPYFEVCRIDTPIKLMLNYEYECIEVELGNSFEEIDSLELMYSFSHLIIRLVANSVTKINESAFYSKVYPTCFIGKNVECVEAFAFQHSSIQTIYIPNCKVLGYCSFRLATSLRSIDISNCNYIDGYALYNCNIKDIRINKNTKIHECAYNSSGRSDTLVRDIATFV